MKHPDIEKLRREAYEAAMAMQKGIAARLNPNREASQEILMLKGAGCEAAEDGEERYTFRCGDRFGFSERLVNVLMQYAYDLGAKGIDKRSFEQGYAAAWSDVAKRLGLGDKEDQ